MSENHKKRDLKMEDLERNDEQEKKLPSDCKINQKETLMNKQKRKR